MEAEHPKIRLDSLAEYRLVYSTIEKLAQEKLAVHFPKEENGTGSEKGGGDAYRKRVETLVDEYVERLFNLANHSISINGNDIGTVADIRQASEDEEYQRFDDTLRARVQSLQDQIDKTTMTVTQMRRNVPKQTADRLQAQMQQQMEQDLNSPPSLSTVDGQNNKTGDKDNGWEIIQNLPRQDEIEKNWENLMIKLGELRDNLPTTTHKLTRAQEAVDYINEKSRKEGMNRGT